MSVAIQNDKWFVDFEISLEKNRSDIRRLQDRLRRLQIRGAQTAIRVNTIPKDLSPRAGGNNLR